MVEDPKKPVFLKLANWPSIQYTPLEHVKGSLNTDLNLISGQMVQMILKSQDLNSLCNLVKTVKVKKM